MAIVKRWRRLGLGGGHIYKFTDPGQILEGIWGGTKPSARFKDSELGVIKEEEGTEQLFAMTAGLRDLIPVKPGTEVKITYLGLQTAMSGNEFKAYAIDVAEDAEVADDSDEEIPF
jgi:hypothetical protein